MEISEPVPDMLTGVHCEEVSAGCGGGPVKMPVIVGSNRHPTSLLEISDDDRLVDVDTVGHAGTHFRYLKKKQKNIFRGVCPWCCGTVPDAV